MDLQVALVSGALKILFVLAVVVGAFAPVLVWAERRQSAMIQDRVGPHRAGVTIFGRTITLAGLLHPLADALKMIFKEDFVPPRADKFLHAAAPILTVVPALASFAVIPFADVLYLEYAGDVIPRDGAILATAIPMQVASLNVGILFIFAVAGTGVIGAAIGGYASDNKFSLLGGVRAASQMVSYEVALGLTLVPCFMVYSTLRLEQMAAWQAAQGVWGIFIPPLTFSAILFLFAAIAETKRIPFDVPEGESELVGGYLTEYSGMKFGMFFTGEFVEVVALAAIGTVLFFGGWDVPFLYRSGFDLPGTWEVTVPVLGWTIRDTIPLVHGAIAAIHVGATLVKIVLLIWFQLMIRWSLPRFRYDQIMALCWKGLLPLSLVNILITGVLVLWWG